MNWVWVVGGGILQVPVIKEFQQRGLEVLVTDRDIHALGCQVADTAIELDTYDIAGHLDLARKYPVMPKTVLTDAADVGPTVSALAEYYGTPACNYVGACNARDKAKVRVLLDQPHPVYVAGNTQEDAYELWSRWVQRAINYDVPARPCIIKAADNCASRGMMRVDMWDQFDKAIDVARLANHLSDNVVVEEQLNGWEVAVDFLVLGDEVLFVNGAKRVFGDFGIEVGHTNPWVAPFEVCKIANDAAKKLGVNSGPFKLDLLYDQNYGWCVLECATRWSGGFDHTHSAVLATGRNLVKVLADYALGCQVNRADLEWQKQGFAAVYAPVFEAGEITGWDTTEAESMPGVSEIVVRETKRVSPLKTCADRPIFVIAAGDTEQAAWQNAVNAGEKVRLVR